MTNHGASSNLQSIFVYSHLSVIIMQLNGKEHSKFGVFCVISSLSYLDTIQLLFMMLYRNSSLLQFQFVDDVKHRSQMAWTALLCSRPFQKLVADMKCLFVSCEWVHTLSTFVFIAWLLSFWKEKKRDKHTHIHINSVSLIELCTGGMDEQKIERT